MEKGPAYEIPKIDNSPKSMLLLAQLGFFLTFAAWGVEEASSTTDWIFPIVMVAGGLSLFLSVPNSRLGATIGIPATMVLYGLLEGEPEAAFWAVFMLILVGSLAYLPALAIGDETLDLDDGARTTRFGAIYTLLTLFMVFLFSVLIPSALDGEFEDEGDEESTTYVLDSNDQAIAQGGVVFAGAGLLIFIGTAILGLEIGPIRPWHGGVLISAAVSVDSYLWYFVADTGYLDIAFALAAGGLFTLSPLIAYES